MKSNYYTKLCYILGEQGISPPQLLRVECGWMMTWPKADGTVARFFHTPKTADPDEEHQVTTDAQDSWHEKYEVLALAALNSSGHLFTPSRIRLDQKKVKLAQSRSSSHVNLTASVEILGYAYSVSNTVTLDVRETGVAAARGDLIRGLDQNLFDHLNTCVPRKFPDRKPAATRGRLTLRPSPRKVAQLDILNDSLL